MADDETITFSLVTGASSGIGFELAKVAAEHGSDLLIVSDGPEIHAAAEELRDYGVEVIALEADLSTIAGVDAVHEKHAEMDRPLDAIFANAGRGLGHGFLDQNFDDIEHVIDTNITGTLYLLHRFVGDMRDQGWGKVLITGSIAGFIPGTYNAIYNASKAFIDNFAFALREELADSGITVTVLMPGATDTNFFEAAGLEDTKLAAEKKEDPAKVARVGFEAMLRGDDQEISGLANKLQAMMARILPSEQLARMHEHKAKPGSAKRQH